MRLFSEMEGFFTHKWGEIQTLYTLTRLEAKLARLSLLPALVSLVLIGILVPSLWLTITFLVGYSVFWLVHNVFIAIGASLLFNMILLGGLIKYLLMNIRNMSFMRTRKYLSNQTHTEAPLHELKKPTHRRVRHRRKAVAHARTAR